MCQGLGYWPRRLTVRTAGSQPVNRSPILRGVTLLHRPRLHSADAESICGQVAARTADSQSVNQGPIPCGVTSSKH